MNRAVATLILISITGTLISTAEQYAGWAVGHNTGGYATIIHTIDSGNTWVRQGSGQVADVALSGVFAVDPDTAWAVGNSVDGYGSIYRTTDGGQNWIRMGMGKTALAGKELGKVHVNSTNIWVLGHGTILYSSDGGTNWVDRIPAGYDNVLLQGLFSLGSTVWIGGEGTNTHDYATMLKSTDTGRTWNRVTGGDITQANHILGISAANADTLWCVGGDGFLVFRSDDGGQTWLRQPTPGALGDANEVSAVDTNNVWVAVDNFIEWSTDGGSNWATHTTTYYTMGISAVNTQDVWAVINGENPFIGKIYHTDTGGTNWQEQTLTSGGPLAPLWTVSFAKQAVPEPGLIGTFTGLCLWVAARCGRKKAQN